MLFGFGQQKPPHDLEMARVVRTFRPWRRAADPERPIKNMVLFVALLAVSIRLASAQPVVEDAFGQFFDAKNLQEAASASAAVVRSGVSFDMAFARLKKGRTYAADAPRGVVRLSHTTPVGEFQYTLDVPQAYHPSKRYQVRVQLHGGVGRPTGTLRGDGSIGALSGAEQIYVIPSSWADAPWWGTAQLGNLRVILDTVKRTYNVDENRIAMSGVSDGGTGAYYFAMRDPTPFASFLPLNGFIMILANPSLELGEQLFPQNLLNRPFFVVNGGRDPLYPTSAVEPYLRHLQKGGVTIDYQPQPNGGHNTAWWPEVKDTFEAFVRTHPRDPHPAKLTWETEAPPANSSAAPGVSRSEDLRYTYNRAQWLVIDTLAARRAETPLPDLNEFESGAQLNFGVRSNGMRITSVVAGSNADKIGLTPDDWVLSINGRSLPGALDLLEFLSIYNPGDPLTLGISRDNKPLELSGVFNPTTVTRLIPLFPRPTPHGRVDLVREGNTIRATTRGVAAFTLLASPDVFDFARPVTVLADGRTVFSGRLERSVATLMKWAAIDNDRTMLYGAEIHVRLE